MQHELIRLCLFSLFSLPVVIYDIKTMKIPVLFSYAGLVFLCAYLFFTDESIFKILLSIIFPLVVFMIVKIICPGGIGNGDIHYSFFCGIFGGIVGINIGLFLAAFFAAIYMMTTKSKKIPFCPFMFFGLILSRILVLFDVFKLFSCYSISDVL